MARSLTVVIMCARIHHSWKPFVWPHHSCARVVNWRRSDPLQFTRSSWGRADEFTTRIHEAKRKQHYYCKIMAQNTIRFLLYSCFFLCTVEPLMFASVYFRESGCSNTSMCKTINFASFNFREAAPSREIRKNKKLANIKGFTVLHFKYHPSRNSSHWLLLGVTHGVPSHPMRAHA